MTGRLLAHEADVDPAIRVMSVTGIGDPIATLAGGSPLRLLTQRVENVFRTPILTAATGAMGPRMTRLSLFLLHRVGSQIRAQLGAMLSDLNCLTARTTLPSPDRGEEAC